MKTYFPIWKGLTSLSRRTTWCLIAGVFLVLSSGIIAAFFIAHSKESEVAARQQDLPPAAREAASTLTTVEGLTPDTLSNVRENPLSTWLTAMTLVIPKIEIDAPIEAVGITEQGNMGVPQQDEWSHVGLYKFAQRPGNKGSALISGHLDRPGGSPAVFWRLKELKAGDTFFIREQGKTLTFVVDQVVRYRVEELPLRGLFEEHLEESRLHLITCAGSWDAHAQQTTERLVVSSHRIA